MIIKKMKYITVISFLVLIKFNLFGIERYAIGDVLFVWSEVLDLQEHPDSKSKVITQIEKGQSVIVGESKYSKAEDFLINVEPTNWEKVVTGKWVFVSYKNQKGFVFDACLSKYTIKEIHNVETYDKKLNLDIPDFETYERILKDNGVILEKGIGLEWEKIIYYLPDLSLEEAIYFIKEDYIDYEFGEKRWIVDPEEQLIQMMEIDEVSMLEIIIRKIENLCIIVIEDGV